MSTCVKEADSRLKSPDEIFMNRIEKVREIVDDILFNMTDAVERRCAYLHLYGVAQACALIGMKREANAELAVIAGMLHDIHSYATMDSTDHAHKGAKMAEEILKSTGAFEKEEIKKICDAIYNHSDKAEVHSLLDEILKDADVMQHCLYNPLFEVAEHEKARFEKLKEEFAL